ncbi:MAG TPA: DNA translocase FtsK [Chloroflexia bacterium]|nr:DNA translocase FtsK [Chloroflexia bacterium]
MRDLLDHHANAIEYVLHQHEIHGRVAGGSLSARLIHFQLQLPPTVRPSRIAPLLPAIAEHLEVPAVRLAPDPETGELVLEVPRPDPVPVRLLPLAKKVAQVVPPCTATLGLDTVGTPLLLRLDAPEVCPTLISGAPGAGKSGLLQTMAVSMALHNSPDTLRLLLIDLSGPGRRGRRTISPWLGVAALPHLVTEPVREPQEAHIRLRWVSRLLNERVELQATGESIEGAALVVLIDGLEEIAAGARAAESLDLLDRLAREGRELGVHLVAASQGTPLIEQLTWGARLIGRCKDANQARQVARIQGSGAEGLLGEGDFLALLGGDAVRFQAATLSPEELARTVAMLQRVAEHEELSAEMELQARRPPPGPKSTKLLQNRAGARPNLLH